MAELEKTTLMDKEILDNMDIEKDDEQFLLIDKSKGFLDDTNIKIKMRGFNERTEQKLYPLVDKQSMILFDIVQELELKEILAITNLIHSHPEPTVPISRKLLPIKSGSQIKLKILRIPAEDPTDDDDSRASNSNNMEKPLELGWKREIYLQPRQGPCTGDVIYYSPDGVSIASLKEMEKYLKDNPSVDLRLEDFSFFAQPFGLKDVKKEVVILPKKSAKPRKPAPIPQKPTVQIQERTVRTTITTVRRSIQPPKRYATGETSFHPEKKSRMGQKVEPESRAMTMGMLPPKYPKMERNFAGMMETSIASNETVKKRGRPPKVRPIAPKPIMPRDAYEEEGDGLFQISALQFSNSLLSSYEMSSVQEESHFQSRPAPMLQRKPSPQHAYNAGHSSGQQISGHTGDHAKGGRDEELLPCSIRCAGMTGEVPTLQCKRCLCLYHPECIGLPPNLNFIHFLCSNCEGKGNRNHTDETPEHQTPLPPPPPLYRKAMPESNAKKWAAPNIPTLPSMVGPFGQRRGVDSSGFQSIGQGGMSVKRLDTVQSGSGLSGRQTQSNRGGTKVLRPGMGDLGVSISAISMKRGRGRPPRRTGIVVPQISRNISMAPISIPIRGPRPQVPNLSLPSAHSTDYGSFNRNIDLNNRMTMSKRGGKRPNKILPSVGRAGAGMVPHIPRKIGPPPKLSFGSTHQRTVTNIVRQTKIKTTFSDHLRRYPQEVITIESRKFVVVPRGRSSVGGFIKRPSHDLKSSFPGAHNTDIATSEQILLQVFPYLSVKDLLSASRVNTFWNRISTKPSLWKVVRMKNTHVYDVDAFVTFLNKQETSFVDLRKMSVSPRTDMSLLLKALPTVSSLVQLVLGASNAPDELTIENFHKLCPRAELHIL